MVKALSTNVGNMFIIEVDRGYPPALCELAGLERRRTVNLECDVTKDLWDKTIVCWLWETSAAIAKAWCKGKFARGFIVLENQRAFIGHEHGFSLASIRRQALSFVIGRTLRCERMLGRGQAVIRFLGGRLSVRWNSR